MRSINQQELEEFGKGFDYVQLPSMTLLYIDFLRGLKKNGIIGMETSVELIDQELADLPKDQTSIIKRVNEAFVDHVYGLLEAGYKNIFVCRSKKTGQRYTAAFDEKKHVA